MRRLTILGIDNVIKGFVAKDIVILTTRRKGALQNQDVYIALAYYHKHYEEIRQQIRSDDEIAKQLQAQTPSLLQQKLKN